MTDGMKYFLGAVGIVTLLPRWPRRHERHAGCGSRAHPRNWSPQSHGRSREQHSAAILPGSADGCVGQWRRRAAHRLRPLRARRSAAHARLLCRTAAHVADRHCGSSCRSRHDRDFFGACIRRAAPLPSIPSKPCATRREASVLLSNPQRSLGWPCGAIARAARSPCSASSGASPPSRF